MTLADAGSHCTNFWCDYVSTQFDPAHILSELGFTIVFELVQIVLVLWLWRKIVKPLIFRQVHKQIDAEHNIVHHDDHVHTPKEPLHGAPVRRDHFQPFPPE